MASVNPLSRELVFKIVYYGPGLGGKTTTLEYLHATAKPEHRGKLVSLATPVDRTLYFDFLPVRLPPVRGMNVRLQLFTVPGQVYFNATRKLVLTGADGIVFVSDSQIVRADANLESLENLRENLAEQGRDLRQIPLIFQHNKRDLPDVLPLEELDGALNSFQALSLATSAKTGLGIYEGLEEISLLVLRAFETRLPDVIGGGFGTSFDAIEGGLVTALRDASPPPSAQFDAVVSRLSPPSAPWPTMPPNSTLGDPSSSDPLDEALSEDDMPLSDHLLDGLEPFDDLAPLRPEPAPPQRTTRAEQAPPQRPEQTPRRHPEQAPPQRAEQAPPRAEPPRAEPERLAETPAVARVQITAGAAAARAPSPEPRAQQAALSFAALWPTADRDAVAEVEAAIASQRYALAIERCDALVERLLANAADLFGSAQTPRDPAVVPLLLGLDGRRYLGFRSAVLKARAGGDVTARDALAAFAFAIDARLAHSAI